MDMGVENRNLYTADVTRTVPVSGQFSPAQRDVYDIVYRSQQAGIDAVAPGVRYEDVAAACNRVLAEGLYDLELLPCSVDEALDKENMVYRRWTLHGFGHMLGLDVHDCAARPQGALPRRRTRRGLRPHRRARPVLPVRRRPRTRRTARRRRPDRGRHPGHRDRRRGTCPPACRATPTSGDLARRPA